MSNNLIDHKRHDRGERVHIYVDADVYACLYNACAPGQMVDELVESLLADERQWPALRDRLKAPAFEESPAPYHHDVQAPVHVKNLPCKCCTGGCRCAFTWRGQYRCGCTPERIATMDASGTPK